MFLAWLRIAISASRSYNTLEKVMCSAISEWRRAVKTGEGVESPDSTFAEWQGFAASMRNCKTPELTIRALLTEGASEMELALV